MEQQLGFVAGISNEAYHNGPGVSRSDLVLISEYSPWHYKNKEAFKGKNVGIILTGGNVDLTNLPF